MTPIDRLVAVRPAEFAHGMTRLAMRRSIGSFITFTLFGLLLLAAIGVFAALHVALGRVDEEPLGSFGGLCFMLAWVAILLPWSRMRLFALYLKLARSGALAPYRIVSFGPGTMSVTSEFGESTTVFGRFEERFETASVFVLARTDHALGSVIPKRVFADDAEVAAFRAAFFAGSAAGSEALHAMSEPVASDAIRYVLTPAEHRRGLRHLVRRTATGRILVVFLLIVLGYVGYQTATLASDSLALATLPLVLIGAAVMLGIRRADARLRGLLTEITFAFDDVGLRLRGSSGSLDSDWSDVRELLEDELVLVLRLPRDVGIIVPKRALDAPTLEALRVRAGRAQAANPA